MSLTFVLNLFRLVVWCTIAVWIHPRLLDGVGGHGFAVWVEHHRTIHFLGLLPLGVLGLISVLEPLDTPQQRAKAEALAARLGATLSYPRGLDPTYGLRQGPGMRVPVGRWSADVAVWKQKSKTRTVARLQVPLGSGFSFAARGTDREPEMLRGLQQIAISQAMRELAGRNDDPAVAIAAQAMAYLSEPPLSVGSDGIDRAVVLRSNHPDQARALFTDPGVVSALNALNQQTRLWDWTLFPTPSAAASEMRIELPGGTDEQSLRPALDLLRHALEQLADQGALAA